MIVQKRCSLDCENIVTLNGVLEKDIIQEKLDSPINNKKKGGT